MVQPWPRQVASALPSSVIWNKVGLPAWSHIQRLSHRSNVALKWKYHLITLSLSEPHPSRCLDFSLICLVILPRTPSSAYELHFAWLWPLHSLVCIRALCPCSSDCHPHNHPPLLPGTSQYLALPTGFGPAGTRAHLSLLCPNIPRHSYPGVSFLYPALISSFVTPNPNVLWPHLKKIWLCLIS